MNYPNGQHVELYDHVMMIAAPYRGAVVVGLSPGGQLKLSVFLTHGVTIPMQANASDLSLLGREEFKWQNL
jgi:hypothetical protein